MIASHELTIRTIRNANTIALLVLVTSAVLATPSQAEEWDCGFDIPDSLRGKLAPSDCTLEGTHPDIGVNYAPGLLYTVRLVFHLGEASVADSTLYQQVDYLNDAFAGALCDSCPDTGIDFELVAIDRFIGGGTIDADNNEQREFAELYSWDPDFYCNVYIGNNGSTLLGTTAAPTAAGNISADNIFVDDSVIGDARFGEDKGHVLTHEMGHYFGLPHIFNGGCNPSPNCYTTGDLICDTNPEPEDPVIRGCPASSQGCTGVPMNLNNYMSYRNSTCLTGFTVEQVGRMRCVLTNYRATLLDAVPFEQVRSGDIPVEHARSIAWHVRGGTASSDIYLVRESPYRNVLFSTDGESLVEQPGTPGVTDDSAYGRGGVWVNLSGPGADDDLALLNRDGTSYLMNQDENGDFSQTPFASSILDNLTASYGFAWADFDRDGDVDCYVAGAPDGVLLRDDEGIFVDATSGVHASVGTSVSAAWSDLDNDGWVDLVVVRNSGVTAYRNDSSGGFLTDITVSDVAGPTGVTVGDVDGDGWMDLVVTAKGGEDNEILLNGGGNSFSAGTPTLRRTGFETVHIGLADLDNDRDLDAIASAAIWYTEVGRPPQVITIEIPGVNQVYLNDGSGSFSSVFRDAASGACVAVGDADGDGDSDWIGAEDKGNFALFRNELVSPGESTTHWVNFDLEGDGQAASILGSRVAVYADGSATPQLREIDGGYGAHAQNSPRLHFGLGSSSVIDSVRVRWPSGLESTYTGLSVDQLHLLEAPLATAVDDTPGGPPRDRLDLNVPNPFNPTTTISYSVVRDAHVELEIYDLAGRHVRTLVSGRVESGEYEVEWNGTDAAGAAVASGVYLYRLRAGAFTETRRMVLVK